MYKEKFIHDIITSIKFLYPCITYDESFSENELVVISETRISDIYPIKKIVAGMVTIGDDFWGRTLFKDAKEQYYCDLDGVLFFKGNDIEGDPRFEAPHEINYEYPTIDSELIEFYPCIDELKRHFANNELVDLIDTSCEVKHHHEDERKSKILCKIRFKIKCLLD